MFYRGLDILGEISLSNTRQSGFAKAAMDCLLDSNLPAKYAMTGTLGPNNIIQDGFYDCGPVRNLFKMIVGPFDHLFHCLSVSKSGSLSSHAGSQSVSQ